MMTLSNTFRLEAIFDGHAQKVVIGMTIKNGFKTKSIAQSHHLG
jgi:hypothetical protein